LLLFVSGLALIFLAWPGWLQGFRDTGRHVAWAVQPNSSLERVAQTLGQWRKDGKLSEADRGFAVHPSVVHYCAWYCPKEKGFLDSRVSLFADVAGEFEEVCRAVNPSFGSPSGDWRKILRAHGITHLILYEERGRLLPALSRVSIDESDWTLLDINGQALLVGWKDNGRALPSGVPAFDAERLAFAPETMGERLTLPAAPGQGPPRGPRTADFWSHFGRAVPPPSWETDAADVLLHYSDFRAMKRQPELMVSWFGWAAGVCTQPALSAGSLDGALRLAVQFGPTPLAPADPSERPPALLLLAVRAARSALANNPDNTGAWMNLGGAYFALSGQTPERVLLASFPPLSQLRRIQIAVALENALRLNPDLQPAHENLANLYEGQRYLDIALDHWREAVRLAQRGGPSPGETAEAFADRLKPVQAHIRDLQRFVGDQKNQFALNAQKAGSEPYRKARFAKQLGLAKLALEDILMQSTMVLLGGEGIRLEMELMLEMGRIEPVREQLNSPDWQANKQNLGFFDVPAPTGSAAPPAYRLPAYDWLWLCQAAAAGDYDQADDALRALAAAAALALDGGRGKARPREEIVELRRAMSQVLSLEIAMSMNNLNWLPRYIVSSERQLLSEPLARYSRFLTEQADMQVIAGLLALERGKPQTAKEAFEQTLTLSRLGGGESHPSVAQPLALAYLQLIRDAQRGK
jgi:tetratricopeptide (TPR) repeat protein